jgi:hypothetical protein
VEAILRVQKAQGQVKHMPIGSHTEISAARQALRKVEQGKYHFVWVDGAVPVYGMLNSLPNGAGKQRAKAAVIQALDQGIQEDSVPNAVAMLKIATGNTNLMEPLWPWIVSFRLGQALKQPKS